MACHSFQYGEVPSLCTVYIQCIETKKSLGQTQKYFSQNDGRTYDPDGVSSLSVEGAEHASDVSTVYHNSRRALFTELSLERLALIQSKYIIARIVQSFASIENQTNGEWITEIGFSATNKHNVFVRVTE